MALVTVVQATEVRVSNWLHSVGLVDVGLVKGYRSVKNLRYSTINWASLLQVNVFHIHCLYSIKPFCKREKKTQRNWNAQSSWQANLETVEQEHVSHWGLRWQVFWLIIIIDIVGDKITQRFSEKNPLSFFKVRAKRIKKI